MNTTKNVRPIVVGTDFTKQCSLAVTRAAGIAAETGAELYLVNAVPYADPTGGTPLLEPWLGRPIAVEGAPQANEVQAEAEKSLASVEVPAGVKVHRLTRVGDPREVLVKTAESTNAQLIVVGSHAPKGMVDQILGSTAERVLRMGHCPVLLARKHREVHYRHLLIAVDFSPMSVRVIRVAHELFPEAKITLGTVIQASRGDQQTRIHLSESELALESLGSEAGLEKGDFGRVATTGDPRHGIMALGVAKQPQLVVVGTHARKGVARFLIGSVAEFVARMAPIDVLAIPPEES